jgi:hypothetical protein
MESNNFEKEVSRKLGEFKIPPEEEVWSRIEKEIAPKRRTGKGVLLFLLLLIISAGVGWWLTHQNSGSKSSSTYQNVVKRENENETKEITSPQGEENMKTTDADVSQSAKPEAGASSSGVEIAASNPTKGISQKSNPFTSANPVSPFVSTPAKQFSTKPTEVVAVANEPKEDFIEIPVPGQLVTIPWFENLSTSKPLHFQTLNTSAPVVLTLKKQSGKKRKWTIGFTLSAGSAWVEGKQPHALYANNVPGSSFNTSYVYYPLRSSYVYYPSRPTSFRTSFSFTAGVFAERNLTGKTSVSVGLSYSHLSLQNNVTNHFEFVQLPVLFHFRVNRNDHLPLTFDAGVMASQLAAGNAQQYNYFSNRWYHDNELFNKFQANLHTGFSFTVFDQKGRQIRVGPAFSYGVTPMANHGLYEGKHLGVLNLHAEMLFGKK